MSTRQPQPAEAPTAIAPIERQSLHRLVVERVRDLVVDGTLPAGQRINEVRLCGQLGVSRTPLREALKVLASEGLVELSRNRGATVAVLSKAEIRDMIMLMSRLEAFAAEAAVRRLDEAGQARLRAMHDAILDAYARGDRQGYFKLNQDFHLAIVELAGNIALAPIHAALHARMKRVRYLGNDVPAHWAESVTEHQAIILAFERRDADAAAAAMRAHLENAWRRAETVMRASDDDTTTNREDDQ
jgi:DNA-binding GntR family transcriptional regulator